MTKVARIDGANTIEDVLQALEQELADPAVKGFICIDFPEGIKLAPFGVMNSVDALWMAEQMRITALDLAKRGE